MAIIKFINHLYFVMSIIILPTIDAISQDKNYVPPSAWTLDTYRAYGISIPKDRRSDCVQSYSFSEGFSKEKLQQQYKKWKQNNTGTYVFVFKSFPLKEKILFIKNGKLKKGIYKDCKNEFHGFLFELQKCKYALKNIQDGNKTVKSFLVWNMINKEYLIDGIFEKAKKRDINESQYCLHPEVQLTYDNTYGYINSYIEKRPNCNCLPRPLQYKSFFHYGLLMLPKETEFTDEVVAKILSLYDKVNDCIDKHSDTKLNTNQNLTPLEKEIGKTELECYKKYLVWDRNVTK